MSGAAADPQRVLGTILKHDAEVTSYMIALPRAESGVAQSSLPG
jgi:hypothetical protein